MAKKEEATTVARSVNSKAKTRNAPKRTKRAKQNEAWPPEVAIDILAQTLASVQRSGAANVPLLLPRVRIVNRLVEPGAMPGVFIGIDGVHHCARCGTLRLAQPGDSGTCDKCDSGTREAGNG